MKAMVMDGPNHPLRLDTARPRPVPGPGQVLVRVHACGVCRTDLHVVDGELAHPNLPLVPGHEIIGTVEEAGPGAGRLAIGQRIGIPWLGWTCGECDYCRNGRENLCAEARFTGYQIDGGYGELTVADERYCFAIPDRFSDEEAAPLMCAGLIGYRALRMASEGVAGEAFGQKGRRLGLYGFGAAAHIAIQVARHRGQEVYAFTRPGDAAGQQFARDLGAVWAGSSEEPAPVPLDAAILFAPVGALVPQALKATARGGIVVCAGIHMSDIPSFPYHILWEERVVRSVANLTRRDGEEFLAVAAEIPVRTTTTAFRLEQANEALACLRDGRLEGAAVLIP